MAKKLIPITCLLLTLCACNDAENDPAGETVPDVPTPSNPISRISILGDSYSAYVGYNHPATNTSWYPIAEAGADVTVDDMWWHILCQNNGWTIEANNSWTGTTICNTGYDGADYSRKSFVSRVHNLGQNPDLIFVFGGTNDSWAGVPLGEYTFSDWTDSSLYQFRPALAYVLAGIRGDHPDAAVKFILNDSLDPAVNQSVDSICGHYFVDIIRLHDIDKRSQHPTILGMTQIAAQIQESLH